ncbi:hypothetical protein PVK06_034813 [Gossypium arboreum]|uniref:Uncharacterized protein n=1 Tax=Gossypium arboreum TaxID=29729 RepID=A0ABR0NF77_GOSAR|nr:hypothetical protein PVK06_034813 [Gossypium arboreum]
MLQMGFCSTWVSLIMLFVSTVSYSMLALREGGFRGIRIGRSDPSVTHLLFANDCMIFGLATTESAATGGRGVFIKSVLQEIPTFAMQCFLFPISLCHDLEAIMSRFRWQKSRSHRRIPWCSWASLCTLKHEGGLDFRNLAKFNIALSAKQD